MDTSADQWVEIEGKWFPRIAPRQVWRAKGSKRTITVRRLADDQPTRLIDGTRKWRVTDDRPMPQYRDGRDVPEALIWAKYELHELI